MCDGRGLVERKYGVLLTTDVPLADGSSTCVSVLMYSAVTPRGPYPRGLTAWDDFAVARIRSRMMVGRDAELTALTAAAARARQGELGLVLVTGEGGIGKSRLVSELVGGVDALTLVSHGVVRSTGEIPFGVLADLLKNLLGDDPTVLTDYERDAPCPAVTWHDMQRRPHHRAVDGS